jgi:hypothetical protein
MRWRWLWLLVPVFLLAIAARLPARWASSYLPAPLSCETAAGTVWNGNCARLRYAGQPLGRIAWQLRAIPLLRGQVEAQVSARLTGIDLQRGRVLWSSPQLELRDFEARIDLAAARALPLWAGAAPWPANLTGEVQLQLENLKLEMPRQVLALGGTIDVNRLQQAGVALGSYRAEFSEPPNANGQLVGRLSDRGGPLDLRGAITLGSQPPGYRVDAQVALRDSATDGMRQQLQFFGPVDSTGRRNMSFEGTF